LNENSSPDQASYAVLVIDGGLDQDGFFARVVAAFFAAAERPVAPLVCAAFLAAAEREPAVPLAALIFAWEDSADLDAALWPSLFSVWVVAFERFDEGLR
jgi:hypothetical protein